MSGDIYQMGRRHTLTAEFQHKKNILAFVFKVAFQFYPSASLQKKKLESKKKKIQI